MAFSYTEVLKAASPLRGGPYAGFAMGTWGNTAAGTNGLISTTLASVVHVTLNLYGTNHQASAFVASVSSNGMIAVNNGAAASGSWIAFGN